jgi:hypothetical protein
MVVLDSDSSQFSWIKDENGVNTTVRNPDFPNNYIAHIKENIGVADIIFVSSHADVRKSLVENQIPFTLVYPNISLKNEYVQRYINRGNAEGFIKLVERSWNEWIEQCDDQLGCSKIVLDAGEFITDRI